MCSWHSPIEILSVHCLFFQNDLRVMAVVSGEHVCRCICQQSQRFNFRSGIIGLFAGFGALDGHPARHRLPIWHHQTACGRDNSDFCWQIILLNAPQRLDFQLVILDTIRTHPPLIEEHIGIGEHVDGNYRMFDAAEMTQEIRMRHGQQITRLCDECVCDVFGWMQKRLKARCLRWLGDCNEFEWNNKVNICQLTMLEWHWHFGLKMRPSACNTVIDSSQPNDFSLDLPVLRFCLVFLAVGLAAIADKRSRGQASVN